MIVSIVSSVYVQHPNVRADALPPVVRINFAGNLSDSGGAYWSQWNETTAYAGAWGNGSYANDSRQSEDWMYINCTVSDGDGVANVWLNWYNLTGDVWTNWTYAFSNPSGDWWEYNTSGNVQVNEGYDYSFDVVANDTIPNSVTRQWNKTAMYGDISANHITRRYVQLNCSTTNISYTPLYIIKINETHADPQDDYKHDRLHHDQGTDGTSDDTGYLRTITPGDTVQNIHCVGYVGAWFDESLCIEPFTLDNIYYHVWFSTDSNYLDDLGWYKTRENLTQAGITNEYSAAKSSNRSEIYYNGGTAYDQYYLTTNLLDVTNTAFTDNNIYELLIKARGSVDYPSIINNRSFTSFVLFNVPSDAVLNASYPDSDSDGISDWNELYTNYTNPFLADTDNDGVNDLLEYTGGTDPNNWTDFSGIWYNTAPTNTDFRVNGSVNGSTGICLYPQLNISTVDTDGNQSKIFWETNASGSWGYIHQTNTSCLNATYYDVNFSNASAYGTTYWVRISINDTNDNTTRVYHFSTESGGTMNVTTNATTGIGEQNATLHGYLVNDSGVNCRVGFQWGETTGYGHTDFDLPFTSGWNPSGSSETELFQFPKDIWLYNLSVGSDSTCENFCQQGGIYNTISWIFRYNSTADDLDSWLKDRPVNYLTNIDNSTDHPELYYTFYVSGADTLEFTYDNLTAVTGDEFGHQIGINGGLHLYGLTPGTTYHYRAFATNGTTTVYGADMNFTTATNWSMTLNCYNESDGSPLTDWDVFITNQDGSQTYESTGNSNPHYVNLSNGTCPVGLNIAFKFSRENFSHRIYYQDISLTGNPTLNAYLPFTNNTEMYEFTIVGPLGEFTSPPIEDVQLIFLRYINESVEYEDVSILYTDANGKCTLYLIPTSEGGDYKITMSKDGYETKTVDLFPRDIVYPGDWQYEYRLVPETVTPPVTEYDLFWSDVTFTATANTNGSILIVYSDSNESTTNTQIYLYEIYNETPSLKDTNTKTGNNDYSYYATGLNLSRLHTAVLYFNNTANYRDATSPVSILIYPINVSIDRVKFDLEARIEGMFGPGPFGSGSWVPCIAVIPALIILVSLGPFNTGAGILGSALTLGAMSLVFSIWLTNPFPTLLLAAIGFIIAIGVLYMWAKEAGLHL